jgi:hypothetical protein
MIQISISMTLLLNCGAYNYNFTLFIKLEKGF